MQQQQPEPEPPLGVTALLKQQSEQALREANVEPGSTMMDPKKPPGTAGQPIGTVTTNVFRLDPRDKNARVFHYEVRVDGIRQNESEVDVTFRSNSDHRTSDRRFICHSVMAMFKLREPGIAGDGASLLYYDLAKTLYSLRQLQLPQQGRSFEYTEQQIIAEVNDAIPREFRAYRLTVTPAEQKLVLLSDISYLSADAAAIDRTREQFLDIATSQEVFDRQTGVENSYVNYSVSSYYLLNPSHFGFTAEDCPVFPSNASFLGIGVNKGVRPIRAPNGEVTSGLVVAVKKSAFHINQDETIYQKADALFSSFSDGPELRRSGATALSRRLQPAIKHIFVETIYNQPHTQIFVVDGLTEFDADHYNFVAIIHGRETRVTVTQYYRERYGIRLAHPEMPLIIRTRPNQDNGYYPMELCRILDNQRVKGDQQTPQQLAEMIRKTAVPPAVHFDQNMRLKNSLHLQESAYLRSAGLHVDSEPIQANARLLPPPQVKFLRNPPETPKASDASWNGGEYLVPARCTKWVAIGFEGSEKPPFTADEWTKFVGLFVNKIAQKGMHYAEPDVRFERIPDVPQLKWYLEGLSGEGFEYALIAHSGDSDFHDELKYGERKTEMVIQGVRVQTVKKVLKDGKFLIVENLAHKANVKMGGLNYVIVPPREPQLQALFSDETMFLGFATNHPSGGFGPSRVDNLDLFSSGSSGTGRGRNGNVLRTGRGPNGNRAAASKGPNGNLLRRRSSSRGKTPATRPPSKPQQPNQPTPNPPSVLGFAANIGPKNHSELVGDFRFQPALRQEVAAIIADIVETCVKQFRVHRRKFPRRIVIYRNDCAEGMYQQVLRYEVPLMRAALSKLGCQATFTVIVASKLQSVRVFASQINRQARSADQNVSPGTVVDTGIVHPIWNEFFLTSHSSPQGTSRTPRYAILMDENKLNMDTLELMTHHLCFGHQIIYSPTSLPSPVYIALEYAKRGRNQYNAWYNAWAQENPNQPPTTIRTHEELSQQLSYQNTQYLKNLRVNA